LNTGTLAGGCGYSYMPVESGTVRLRSRVQLLYSELKCEIFIAKYQQTSFINSKLKTNKALISQPKPKENKEESIGIEINN
uniref:hypothetical protein n=1 Tax=Vibrio vulnificus TaxID=672 RepID=UPI000B105045